jgi:hypothetical protein
MPLAPDPSSPAALRYSRTPKKLLAVTSISATGLVTHSANLLDPYQNGDLCTVAEAVAGTPLSTAGPLAASVGGLDKLFRISKVSTTTTQLVDVSTGANPTVAPAAITVGVALQFGGLGTEIKSSNIVAAGSTAGGAFGGPLD